MPRLTPFVSAVFAAMGAHRRKAADRGESGLSRNGGKRRAEDGFGPGGSDHLDLLTGLANRNHFHRHLARMLRHEAGGYVLLTKCNVSRLHDINTSFGYDAGDALLIEVGERLRGLSSAMIGRLSGDEFAVLLPLDDPESSKAAVTRIRDLLAKKFLLPGVTIDVRFSIGYAVGEAGDDSVGLLRQAGIALHESRLSPFLDPIAFDRNAAIRIESRVRLTRDLQQALENGEFLMHYQPKVELATGKIIGAEALLRWEHAVYGTQPPNRFIPIAEDSGLIVEIGDWALRHVAGFAGRVNRGRAMPLTFAVNVSQMQFRRNDVARLVRAVLEQTQAEPSWLMLEMTESLLADDSPAMVATLQDLRSMGIGLSIDDFGTGYSSLSRLDAFPVSEFKIDRSFVSAVDRNRAKQVIVDAMIRLGEELHMLVVAEGAETEEEVAVLRKLGCKYAEGYFFGRPMPEAAFVTLIDGKISSSDQDELIHRPPGAA
jgi:diguanylate cyclase (GGDEF)-like protein